MTCKVLHLHFGKDGGAERFFISLAQALAGHGVEQQFVIRPNRCWRSEISRLGPITENHFRRFSLSALMLQWRVGRLCRSWRPDAIMAWMPRAARLIPDCPHAVKLARLGDFPRHLDHFSRCNVLVGNIPAIGLHCRTLGWERPMLTISNFAPSTIPQPVPRATLDTPDNAFLICGTGRFVPRKGLDLLVRALARLPGAHLWLVGDGEERKALERLARKERVAERVRFAGWVEEPLHYIAAADVLGVPSRHEPFGNVVIEGWRAGVPVVSTRSEGPSWYMSDGQNGALVAIDDLDGLVGALSHVRDDRSYAARLVEGGSQRLADWFSREAIVQQYLQVFDGVFKSQVAPTG